MNRNCHRKSERSPEKHKTKSTTYLYSIITDNILKRGTKKVHCLTPHTYITKHERNQNKIVPLHFKGKKTTERKLKKGLL